MLEVKIEFIGSKPEIHHCKSLESSKYFLTIIYDDGSKNSWFKMEIKRFTVKYKERRL